MHKGIMKHFFRKKICLSLSRENIDNVYIMGESEIRSLTSILLFFDLSGKFLMFRYCWILKHPVHVVESWQIRSRAFRNVGDVSVHWDCILGFYLVEIYRNRG